MKTDSLFYRLFQECPDLVFELAEWSPPAGVRYTLHAEDVKQTGFRLDGILSPPIDRTDLPLFFLEAQFQIDNDFYARWFAEIFLFLFRQPTRRTAWRAVVIFRDEAPTARSMKPIGPCWNCPGYAESISRICCIIPLPAKACNCFS